MIIPALVRVLVASGPLARLATIHPDVLQRLADISISPTIVFLPERFAGARPWSLS
jgi:hypothetical protein